MAKAESPNLLAGSAPVNIDEHTKDRARRQEERDKKRPRLLDCLDPTVAKYHEDRKTLYEWDVVAKIFRPATPKSHAHLEEIKKNVVAQNEGDAWAMFCDLIGEWPSRRDTKNTITQLRKRTLRDNDE